MRRRDLMRLLGSATVDPLIAVVAQEKLPLLGFLKSAQSDTHRFIRIRFAKVWAGFVEANRSYRRAAGGRHEAVQSIFVRRFAAMSRLLSFRPSIGWKNRLAGRRSCRSRPLSSAFGL